MVQDPWWHPDKEWRKSLNLAREYGWPAPVKASSHGGLIISCPGPEDSASEDMPCRMRIYSTARNSEQYARRLRMKVEHCRHACKSPAAQANAYIQLAQHLLELALEEAKGDCLKITDLSLKNRLVIVEVNLVSAAQIAVPLPGIKDADLSGVLAKIADLDGSQLTSEARKNLKQSAHKLRKVQRKNPGFATLLEQRKALEDIAAQLSEILN